MPKILPMPIPNISLILLFLMLISMFSLAIFIFYSMAKRVKMPFLQQLWIMIA